MLKLWGRQLARSVEGVGLRELSPIMDRAISPLAQHLVGSINGIHLLPLHVRGSKLAIK